MAQTINLWLRFPPWGIVIDTWNLNTQSWRIFLGFYSQSWEGHESCAVWWLTYEWPPHLRKSRLERSSWTLGALGLKLKFGAHWYVTEEPFYCHLQHYSEMTQKTNSMLIRKTRYLDTKMPILFCGHACTENCKYSTINSMVCYVTDRQVFKIEVI